MFIKIFYCFKLDYFKIFGYSKNVLIKMTDIVYIILHHQYFYQYYHIYL